MGQNHDQDARDDERRVNTSPRKRAKSPERHRARGRHDMNKTELPFCSSRRRDPVTCRVQASSKPTMRQMPPIDPKADVLPLVVRPSRTEVLRAVQKASGPNDLIVATTGYTGRELIACDDRANQLYMVGSMGCRRRSASASRARPDKRVIVLDGDGALLMRMGRWPRSATSARTTRASSSTTGPTTRPARSGDRHAPVDLAVAPAPAVNRQTFPRSPGAGRGAGALKDRKPGLRFPPREDAVRHSDGSSRARRSTLPRGSRRASGASSRAERRREDDPSSGSRLDDETVTPRRTAHDLSSRARSSGAGRPGPPRSPSPGPPVCTPVLLGGSTGRRRDHAVGDPARRHEIEPRGRQRSTASAWPPC